MTRATPHPVAREELGAAALDALDPAEHAALLAHVAECAECRAELAAYDEAAALLALSLPARPVDAPRAAQLRARLLARARAVGAAGAAAHVPTDAPTDAPADAAGARPAARAVAPAAPPRRRPLGWLAAAAVLAFAVSAALLARATRERDVARVALRAGEARSAARVDSLAAALATSRAMVEALSGSSVRVVELAAAGAREPVARMFWHRAANRWTMIGHNMPRPKPGKTYQLWLVTGSAKISAGTFEPTPAGDAMMQAEYALPPDALQAVAVTEEPAGGMPQPTGPTVMLGKVGE